MSPPTRRAPGRAPRELDDNAGRDNQRVDRTADVPASRTEHRVVWLEDPTDHDYVRVVEHPRNIVTRAPRWTAAGRLVGYTVTVPSRVRGWARLFVIMPWDRSDDPAGTYYQGCPSEAVDPLTVAPGVAGRLTERAWGAPLDCPGPNGWAPL